MQMLLLFLLFCTSLLVVLVVVALLPLLFATLRLLLRCNPTYTLWVGMVRLCDAESSVEFGRKAIDCEVGEDYNNNYDDDVVDAVGAAADGVYSSDKCCK